jgi:predicted nucleic acid-binding protein
VTHFLLDTNILRNATKAIPSRPLMDWMEDQADENLFIASLTVAEIRHGIFDHPAGRKRKLLEEWFIGPEVPSAFFAGRVLPFDQKAGLVWAQLMSERTASGALRSALDTIRAATAVANDCVIITDNEKDFTGLNVLNPMRPTGKYKL